MRDDPTALIYGHLDGELSDEQARELNDWIKADSGHARIFASCALIHDRLHDQYRARAVLREVRSTGARAWRRRALAGATVILGLALAGTWAARRGGVGGVAELVEARDVVWSAGQHPVAVGARLGPRSLRCDSGTFKLRFDAGATVALEGPAELRILSGMRILAVRGRITARVDVPAQGFAVETPNTLVVDRGTEFGVAIDESGRTDVVVFQGLVELSRPEPADRPMPIKNLGRGEGMRVGSGGDLSRIVAVERRPEGVGWTTGPSSDRDAVIRSVRDNIRGLGSSKYYQVVHRGFGEDAPAYVDRTHQWNGLGPQGLPAFLREADYIMTFNEDKWIDDLTVTVDLARAATLYVFYDARLAIPGWLSGRFTDLGLRIGQDEGPWPGGPPQELARGPGSSVDSTYSVWSCDLGPGESVALGNLGRPTRGIGFAMYGIAAVARP